MNLKRETLLKLDEIGRRAEDVEFAKITYFSWQSSDEQKLLIDSEEPFDIEKLNMNYDNGYGVQHICGFIVFRDKTWLERAEYDGAEWWEFKKCPTKETLIEEC